MSHIIPIRTEVRDRLAVERACSRRGLAAPEGGEADVCGTWETGLLVRLEGWEFPAVRDLASGTVECDNYEGHWGAAGRLDAFLQAYAVEKATLEARRRGHSVVEQRLPGGSVKLVSGLAGEAR